MKSFSEAYTAARHDLDKLLRPYSMTTAAVLVAFAIAGVAIAPTAPFLALPIMFLPYMALGLVLAGLSLKHMFESSKPAPKKPSEGLFLDDENKLELDQEHTPENTKKIGQSMSLDDFSSFGKLDDATRYSPGVQSLFGIRANFGKNQFSTPAQQPTDHASDCRSRSSSIDSLGDNEEVTITFRG